MSVSLNMFIISEKEEKHFYKRFSQKYFHKTSISKMLYKSQRLNDVKYATLCHNLLY